MKDYAKGFYSSKAWQKCRAAYKKSVGGLCEVCLSKGLIVPADIVHHKIPITPENINDPHITLDWSNLQCVCADCHAQFHIAKQKRYKLDELGRVTARE
jgi:5-methylcytosine-specific restriction endonuclease McrA